MGQQKAENQKSYSSICMGDERLHLCGGHVLCVAEFSNAEHTYFTASQQSIVRCRNTVLSMYRGDRQCYLYSDLTIPDAPMMHDL